MSRAFNQAAWHRALSLSCCLPPASLHSLPPCPARAAPAAARQEFEGLKDSPAEGVYVYGLFLDGAAWSGRENRLVEAEPKKLYAPLPVLYVTGVLAKVRR